MKREPIKSMNIVQIEYLGEREILPSGSDLYSAGASLSRRQMLHSKFEGAERCGLHL